MAFSRTCPKAVLLRLSLPAGFSCTPSPASGRALARGTDPRSRRVRVRRPPALCRLSLCRCAAACFLRAMRAAHSCAAPSWCAWVGPDFQQPIMQFWQMPAVGTREGRDAYLHAGPFLFGFLPPKTCASAARVTLLVKVHLRAHQRERLCTSGGPSRVRRVASFSSTAHITITALQTDARRGGGSVCHTSRHLRVSREKRKRQRDTTALQPSGICHTASRLWRVRARLHRPGAGARHMPPRPPAAPASGRPYAAPASTVRFPSSSSCRARSGRVGGRPGEADGSCGGPVPLGRRTFWVPGGMRSLAPACRVRSLALGTVQPGSSL